MTPSISMEEASEVIKRCALSLNIEVMASDTTTLSDSLILKDKDAVITFTQNAVCVFTCRYGLEKIGEKDSIGMKTMIASQSYSINGLKNQVMAVNELMFDVWSWCVSDDVKKNNAIRKMTMTTIDDLLIEESADVQMTAKDILDDIRDRNKLCAMLVCWFVSLMISSLRNVLCLQATMLAYTCKGVSIGKSGCF